MPRTLESNAGLRRACTIPGLVGAAIGLTMLAPIWLPLAVLVDLVRGRFRCPTARLLAFGVCWAWLETIGVVVSALLWLGGQRRNRRAHYALQRWWSKHLLGALGRTCGISVEVDGLEAFSSGNALLFVRHASLADSLVSAHVVTNLAGLQPRFVLKRELLLDPCLDVVGDRIPNVFLDRGAADSGPELAAIAALVDRLGRRDVGIIFPEGTRANASKRAAALDRIAARDPFRAQHLASLRHLLPPRPSGARAMAAGAPDADVIVAWHVGFEGLDTFGGILAALNRRLPPIRFSARRVASADVPRDGSFDEWLDEQWLQLDAEVAVALSERTE